MTLEGDLRWITTVERLQEDFPQLLDRSAGSGEVDLRLPTHLGPTTLRSGSGGGVKIDGASFFDLDIDIDDIIKQFVGDPANKAGEIVGDLAGPAIAKWFDKRQVETPGLYSVKTTETTVKLGKQQNQLSPIDDPYLLFLHGTASTTTGSFGGLWTDNRNIWDRVHDRYQDRMFALEHHTLAESPIANALMVAETLPENAKLHLVSHSRGGLIGELLARSGRIGGGLFDDFDFGLLEKDPYRHLKDQLIELHNVLFEKSITIERFVRVACPAAGTTLASGKLDRWLSTMLNVVGRLGLDASAIYRFIKGFALAVVKTRTEPENIPGLEAMMPGSPLTRDPQSPRSYHQRRSLGDRRRHRRQGRSFINLGVWLTDRFYPGDHDLIVDTASMYGGQHRPLEGAAQRFL